jgi:hypothetical protein
MLPRFALTSLGRASRAIALVASTRATAFSTLPTLALDPIVDRFEAVPDCIFPDPRRGILSYMVTDHSHQREGEGDGSRLQEGLYGPP